MQSERYRVLGWSSTAGAAFGAVAFALVVGVDVANTSIALDAAFVGSSVVAAFVAGSILWWRALERPGALTRERAAGVGAAVGFVSPTVTWLFNPDVYGDNPNVLVDVIGAIVAAGVLGGRALIHTFGLPIVLGAVTGWSLAGWFLAFRPDE